MAIQINRLALLGFTIMVSSVSVLCDARADETPYDVNSVEDYLGEKDYVFVGVRLDGGIGVDVIRGLQSDVGAAPFTNEALNSIRLESMAMYPKHRILVVKNLQGELPVTIHLSPEIANTSSMPLADPILVFADIQSGEIAFGYCETAPLDLFPAELVESGDVDGIVRYIRDNRLLCLREPIERRPVAE